MTSLTKSINGHAWFYRLLSSCSCALLIAILSWACVRVIGQLDAQGADIKKLLPMIEQVQAVKTEVVDQKESLRRNAEAVMQLSLKVSEIKGYSEGANKSEPKK